MSDLSQALAEINAIRAQVARGTEFRGYGPVSTAVSGTLALVVALAQSAGPRAWGAEAPVFVALWVATAAVSVALASIDTVLRARREHCEFATPMIASAVEQFLPATVVGLLLTGVLMRGSPGEAWMLPGLWALLFSLGVFASCRFLPRQMPAVGVWYLVCGLACLMWGGSHRTLSPWEMGIPFGVGQWLVAAVLRYGFEESLEEH